MSGRSVITLIPFSVRPVQSSITTGEDSMPVLPPGGSGQGGVSSPLETPLFCPSHASHGNERGLSELLAPSAVLAFGQNEPPPATANRPGATAAPPGTSRSQGRRRRQQRAAPRTRHRPDRAPGDLHLGPLPAGRRDPRAVLPAEPRRRPRSGSDPGQQPHHRSLPGLRLGAGNAIGRLFGDPRPGHRPRIRRPPPNPAPSSAVTAPRIGVWRWG